MNSTGGATMDALFLAIVAGLAIATLGLIWVCNSLLGEKP
jgi:hypothetical protein